MRDMLGWCTNCEYKMNVLLFESLNNTGLPVCSSKITVPCGLCRFTMFTLWSVLHSCDPEYQAHSRSLPQDATVEQWLNTLLLIVDTVSFKTYFRLFVIEISYV